MTPYKFRNVEKFVSQKLALLDREIRFSQIRSMYDQWLDEQWADATGDHRDLGRPTQVTDSMLGRALRHLGFTARKTGGVMVYAPPVAPNDTTD